MGIWSSSLGFYWYRGFQNHGKLQVIIQVLSFLGADMATMATTYFGSNSMNVCCLCWAGRAGRVSATHPVRCSSLDWTSTASMSPTVRPPRSFHRRCHGMGILKRWGSIAMLNYQRVNNSIDVFCITHITWKITMWLCGQMWSLYLLVRSCSITMFLSTLLFVFWPCSPCFWVIRQLQDFRQLISPTLVPCFPHDFWMLLSQPGSSCYFLACLASLVNACDAGLVIPATSCNLYVALVQVA